MKTIKGDLIMKKDMIFNEDLKVEGNIFGKNGNRYNLVVNGNLDCFDLNCGALHCGALACRDVNVFDLNCCDLNCWNLHCWDLNCFNLHCNDLNCGALNCDDLTFCGVAIAYHSFKCKSWKAGRNNYIIKCLDGKVQGRKRK